VGEGVEVPARRSPEHRDERRLFALGDLADGGDPPFAQLPGGDRTDPPESLDRERVEKGELAVRRHHEPIVRLGHPAGDLGEELGPRHPDRDRQTDPLADLSPQPCGDLRRRARDPLEPAHVEERLIDREPLDERRGPFKDLDLLASAYADIRGEMTTACGHKRRAWAPPIAVRTPHALAS